MNIPIMTLADRLLYLLVIPMLPLAFWIFWQPATAALQADIHVNGQYQQHVSLQKNQIIRVHGDLGDSILEVQDGKIRFVDSACSLKRCVHRGWLNHGGDFNACVPNKVSVALLGDGSGSVTQKFDSIIF